MAAEEARAAEEAMAECATTQAWSDLVLAEPFGRFFELEDVERLDMDAVRLGDGYEYRYHRGGRFTWFSKHACAELPVRGEQVMPRHLWLHLPGCTCAACAPTSRSALLPALGQRSRVLEGRSCAGGGTGADLTNIDGVA